MPFNRDYPLHTLTWDQRRRLEDDLDVTKHAFPVLNKSERRRLEELLFEEASSSQPLQPSEVTKEIHWVVFGWRSTSARMEALFAEQQLEEERQHHVENQDSRSHSARDSASPNFSTTPQSSRASQEEDDGNPPQNAGRQPQDNHSGEPNMIRKLFVETIPNLGTAMRLGTLWKSDSNCFSPPQKSQTKE